MHFNLIEGFLIILLIALVVTSVFRFMRMPVILGYLVAGTLLGPHVLGWMQDTQEIKVLAEFGVVLLMFTVGLEFSLPKLFALRHSVFILGSLQVVLSVLVTLGIGVLFDMSITQAFVIGSIVAMSSTAIVIKQLTDQHEITTEHGKNAISILLFQDLAVIPVLIIIANLAGLEQGNFWQTMGWSLLKGIFALVLILGVGRMCMRPILRLITGTEAIELFTLTVLFIAVGAAWLTNALGLSYALGAFIAGIMLAESEHKHQVQLEIRPFRDVLLGLFFVSIGMLVNVSTWTETWFWILLLVAGLMLAKPLLIILLSRLLGYPPVSSTRTGVILAQGGEFGFAILTLALSKKVFPSDWGQAVLAALLISFMIAPFIIRRSRAVANYFLPKQLRQSNE